MFPSLLELDQAAIRAFNEKKITQEEWITRSSEVSRQYLNLLKEGGFPFRDTFADSDYRAGITLALHLPLPDLQYVFSKYIDEQPISHIAAEHKAMFIDKMRVISGKPQLYGTQFKIKEAKGIKTIEVFPLENEASIDKIRSELGLPPLSEYLNQVKISFGLSRD